MGRILRLDIYHPDYVGKTPKSIFVDTWSMSRHAETLSTMDITLFNPMERDAAATIDHGSLVVARGIFNQGPIPSSWMQEKNIEFLGIVTAKAVNKIFLTEFMTVFDTDVLIPPRELNPAAEPDLGKVINSAKNATTMFTASPEMQNLVQLANVTWSIPDEVTYIPPTTGKRPGVIYANGSINIYNELQPYVASLKYHWHYRIYWKQAGTYVIDHIGITLVNTDEVGRLCTFIEGYNMSNVTLNSRSGGVTGDTFAGNITLNETENHKTKYGEYLPTVGWVWSYPCKYYDYNRNQNIKILQQYLATPMPVRMSIQANTVPVNEPAPQQQEIIDATHKRADTMFWAEPLDISFDYNLLEQADSRVGMSNMYFWTGAACYIMSPQYTNNRKSNHMPRITSIEMDSESYTARVTCGYKQMNLLGLTYRGKQ